MPQPHAMLTKEEIEAIVRATVAETLTTLGIEQEDPLEMQKDFQFVREFRLAAAGLRSKSMYTVLGIIITGLCAMAVLGIKSMFTNH